MIKILHIGAWGRNYGDRAIQLTMEDRFMRLFAESHGEVPHFHSMDIQSTDFRGFDFSPYDLVLVGGGGLLWDKPELESYTGWQWRIPIPDLMDIDPPVAIYGIGFTKFPYHDPTGSSAMWAHLSATFAKAKHVAVRNSETLALFKAHGIDRVDLIPDPALFTPVHKAYMVLENGRLVLSPVARKPERFTVGLCWASDKPEWRFGSIARYNEFMVKFATSLRAFVKARDAQVLFIEHIKGMDSGARAYFREAFGSDNFTSVELTRPDVYPASKSKAALFFSVYENCDIVFSARKHGVWIPAGKGIPAIGIGGVKEVQWTMNSLGMSPFCLDEYTTGRYSVQVSADAMLDMKQEGAYGHRIDTLRASLDTFDAEIAASAVNYAPIRRERAKQHSAQYKPEATG